MLKDKIKKKIIIYSDDSKSENKTIESGIFHLNEAQDSGIQY
jgi:hypothetical protein